MAEISRRAGVGMATLYRNFPDRRELLEALYIDEVDAVCKATETVVGETPGVVLIAWLRRFFAFSNSKRLVASELLTQADSNNPVFGESRARVLAAGRPLLAAAQRTQEVRGDLALEQVLDMIVAHRVRSTASPATSSRSSRPHSMEFEFRPDAQPGVGPTRAQRDGRAEHLETQTPLATVST